jgi:hypothetical protein
MFEVDLGRIKFKWRGTWSATETYEADDCVFYAGTSYIAVATGIGQNPATTNGYWDVMATGSDLGSLATGAGDLFYYNGSEFRRLAAGANGQVLKMGVNGNMSWIDPSLISPVIQQKTYSDYVRTNVNANNSYYFGQSSTGVAITPKRLDSLIEIDMRVFGEVSNHDHRYRVEYSTNNGTSWTDLRKNPGNQWTFGKFNMYETNYDSTPGSNTTYMVQAFNTLQPVCFRIRMISDNMTFNGSRSSGNEHGFSSCTLKELNADFNTVTYNGGS